MTTPLGILAKEEDGYKVVFNRTLDHPIQKVWEAITNPEQMKYWFTDIEMDFKPKGKITIHFKDKDKSVSYGEIESIEPPTRFVWTWEGELAVWELEKLGENKTKLTLTYSRLSADYGINALAGFHTLLDRLEVRLAGSDKTYAFGAETKGPEQTKLQVSYVASVYAAFPELVKHKPVEINREYDASPEKVWKALTDKNQLKEWYFALDDFKPEPGFTFQFPGQGHKGEKYLHLCTVTEVIPTKKLQYSWTYEGYPGYSLLTFELSGSADKTLLKLTHHGLETFPQDSDDFAWKSFNEGWTYITGTSLKDYLAK